jgi:hypothetical protein
MSGLCKLLILAILGFALFLELVGSYTAWADGDFEKMHKYLSPLYFLTIWAIIAVFTKEISIVSVLKLVLWAVWALAGIGFVLGFAALAKGYTADALFYGIWGVCTLIFLMPVVIRVENDCPGLIAALSTAYVVAKKVDKALDKK